mmetsp:Transcript_4844/g.14365  ORF Transcript_4844/g.14365 Transcript_4844/m.14365 type:complete len:290 (+) Transcript_4844:112-981(+)
MLRSRSSTLWMCKQRFSMFVMWWCMLSMALSAPRPTGCPSRARWTTCSRLCCLNDVDSVDECSAMPSRYAETDASARWSSSGARTSNLRNVSAMTLSCPSSGSHVARARATASAHSLGALDATWSKIVARRLHTMRQWFPTSFWNQACNETFTSWSAAWKASMSGPADSAGNVTLLKSLTACFNSFTRSDAAATSFCWRRFLASTDRGAAPARLFAAFWMRAAIASRSLRLSARSSCFFSSRFFVSARCSWTSASSRFASASSPSCSARVFAAAMAASLVLSAPLRMPM